MTRLEELKQKAINELDNNDNLFVDVINELDSWNGYADGFRAYPMDELNELHYGMSLTDFLDRITSDFNLNDEYFYYSIYGLESCDDIAELYRDNVWAIELLDNILANSCNIDLAWIDKDFDELIDEIDTLQALED